VAILDLTNFTGRRQKSWPANMPKKIALICGQHQYEYDIHPKHRQEKWYIEIQIKQKELYPWKSEALPIGVGSWDLPDGIKIIGG